MKVNMKKLAILALTALFFSGCATRPNGPGTFSFALIGDQQYTRYEEQQFPYLLNAISQEKLAFVVHVGDFKAGSNAPCTDTLFLKRKREFDESVHPFIYIPGDNDWVDCRRRSNGSADPLERLGKLREIFFAQPESLGKNKLALTRQSETSAADTVLSRYRENMLWVVGEKNNAGVVFATVNVQGSNDNKGFDAASDREQVERTYANLAWLKIAANRARGNDIIGLVVFLQANPGFEDAVADVNKSGFKEFLAGFEREAIALGKPVLFAHGDTHVFRINQPYQSPLDRRLIANITRVEGYGSPFVNWVRITVDANNRVQPFYIESGGFIPVSAVN